MSFDGPPDGSEDHHRGSQQRCARPSTRFPAVQCGGRRRAVPGSRRAGASATESFCGSSPGHAGVAALAPRARPRATTGAVPIRRAVARSRRLELQAPRQPLPPVFGAPGRPKVATAPVHGSGASPPATAAPGPKPASAFTVPPSRNARRSGSRTRSSRRRRSPGAAGSTSQPAVARTPLPVHRHLQLHRARVRQHPLAVVAVAVVARVTPRLALEVGVHLRVQRPFAPVCSRPSFDGQRRCSSK